MLGRTLRYSMLMTGSNLVCEFTVDERTMCRQYSGETMQGYKQSFCMHCICIGVFGILGNSLGFIHIVVD